MDVGSSRTAANVVGTVQGSLKSLVIDLAVLLEGHSTVRFLPVRLLRATRAFMMTQSFTGSSQQGRPYQAVLMNTCGWNLA